MKNTKIQWCHSTVNPAMGCDGCELWPPAAQIATGIETALQFGCGVPSEIVKAAIRAAIDRRPTSEIYADRDSVAERLQITLGLSSGDRQAVIDVIRSNAKCYAGLLGTMRAGHKGYADQFEMPKLYPGRMATAAGWRTPTEQEVADKLWLTGLPRLIFISDMGDVLSKGIPFEYLKTEIIGQVCSAEGSRHIWLWLSKRPARMAQFGQWLNQHGVEWPSNLMAMTTITAQSKASRLDDLRKVPSRLKGLSIEPLLERVHLDLRGVDWIIVGGGSDVLAEPFHVEWALELRKQSRDKGAALFLKQLGKRPFFANKPIDLQDPHGGDWQEWPSAWRVREFPRAFHRGSLNRSRNQ